MSEYVWAVIFIAFGLLGMISHWAKKRYLDKTTLCNLSDYIHHEPQATTRAFFTMVSAEIGLAIAHGTGFDLPLSELVSVLTAGYTADSWLNRAPDSVTYHSREQNEQIEHL